MSQTGTIMTYESGVDVVVEWKIDFFTLKEAYRAFYSSPEFSFGNERWELDIFPNGSSERDSVGYVDLGLWKRGSDHSIRLSFSLSLKTVQGEKYHEVHYTQVFDGESDYHVFNRFIQRSELTMRRSELVSEDVLTVICTMKNTTSAKSDSNVASASAECRHCKETFNADSLSSHQRKCMHRPTKCLDCLEVVILEKWLNEHDCQQERPKGAGSFCEDYKKVLLDGRNHDVILKIGDKELRAHRDILRARSRVFESMLDLEMKEKNTGIIDLPDCDPDAMQLFLSYVYCGKIEALDHNNMLELYYIADKYEMMELKRECCNFIKKSLSLTNICSVIQLALNHSDSELLEYATGYFVDNMLDIMQTVEWQSFFRDNLSVGNELLIKSIKLKNAQK